MGRRPETLHEWLERYEQKSAKAYQNYQETGIQRYLSQYEEYEMIVECITAKIKERQEHDDHVAKRLKECNWVCDRLVLVSYSNAEVRKMLHDAVYW